MPGCLSTILLYNYAGIAKPKNILTKRPAKTLSACNCIRYGELQKLFPKEYDWEYYENTIYDDTEIQCSCGNYKQGKREVEYIILEKSGIKYLFLK